MSTEALESTRALDAVRAELKELFIERDRLVDGALIALLSRQHLLMLGPPGTAKSMLARALCARLEGGTYFEWLLTKFSTPEELFGPISLSALEAGKYERLTEGKLPHAQVAFLDEIFKANSAILNALLTILNERQYHQGNQSMQVPLQTLFAASNELPEEDALGALYDRFLLRFTVGYIEQDYRFARLLRMGEPKPPQAHLDLKTLSVLREQTDRVELPDAILADIIEVRRLLARDGVVASDRRYQQSMTVLRAAALLDGRQKVQAKDLYWLEHVLWTDPEERPKVVAVLSKVASGFDEEAQKLLYQAQEINAYARKEWPDGQSHSRAVLEAHTKLSEISKRLQSMMDAGVEKGRDVSKLEDISTQVIALQGSLLRAQN